MWLCIGQRRRHCHNCRQWCAAVDKSQSPHGSWFQFNCAFLGSACFGPLSVQNSEVLLQEQLRLLLFHIFPSACSDNQKTWRHVEMTASENEIATCGFALVSVLTLSSTPSCPHLVFTAPRRQCQNNTWNYCLSRAMFCRQHKTEPQRPMCSVLDELEVGHWCQRWSLLLQ